jgi:hypothetical protein
MVNSTLTFTGDLGTESKICQCKGPLTNLFGGWVAVHDHAAAADVLDHDAEFDIGPEPGGQDADDGDGFNIVEEGHRDDDEDDDVGGGHDHVGVADGGAYIDLTRSIYVPGLLHIVHNCVKDLSLPLVMWDDFVKQLRHVARLLCKRRSRQRLMETCFSTPPHSFFRNQFAHFNADVYEGRWGTVCSRAQMGSASNQIKSDCNISDSKVVGFFAALVAT